MNAPDKLALGLDSPIGAPLPRPNARRLLAGRGCYVDDVRLPRMAHIVFLRSPHAHAEILGIDTAPARAAPGVLAVYTGADIAARVTPWVGVLTHMAPLKSAPQHAMALGRARWQGEPVVAVVAESRAQAEDAVQLIEVRWRELPALTDPEQALAAGAPIIHPELGDNLAYTRTVDTGGVEEAFARAALSVEVDLATSRHTGVTLEPRSLLAAYNPGEGSLTVWQSTQVPHMMQMLIARHLGLDANSVRVICPDMGAALA